MEAFKDLMEVVMLRTIDKLNYLIKMLRLLARTRNGRHGVTLNSQRRRKYLVAWTRN